MYEIQIQTGIVNARFRFLVIQGLSTSIASYFFNATWYSFVRRTTLADQNIEFLQSPNRSKSLTNTQAVKYIVLSFSSLGIQETAEMGIKAAS